MAGPEKIARLLLRLSSLAAGGVFIYAGGLKALDPGLFATDIANYRLLPWPAAVLLALYLPWVEMLCGAALILKKLSMGAAFILAGLCLVFLAALTSAKMRGLDISCGCFGHAGSHSLYASMLIDAALLACLACFIAAEWKRSRPPSS